MTDNCGQELADLLKAASESFMDVVTAAQTGEGHNSAGSSWAEVVADYLHFLMSAIVGPIVCFFGIAGNLLSIVTWARIGMRGSTNRYLTGQAFANFGMLLTFLLCDSIHYWFPTVKFSLAYGQFFSYVGFPMMYYSIMCSIWFTVGVTVDRFIMVCWITQAKNLCSEFRATICLIFIAVASFIINLPHYASFLPVYPDPNKNITEFDEPVVAFIATDFATGPRGQIYDFWIHCIILMLIPWVSILIMNVTIILKLNKSNRMMADKKSSQANEKSKQSENQITRLLLALSFTFLFCEATQCISHCVWISRPPGANMAMLSAFLALGKTGMIFNSSLNFVLYSLTGRRFRGELLKIFGLVKKDAPMSSLLDSNSTSTATTSVTDATGARGG